MKRKVATEKPKRDLSGVPGELEITRCPHCKAIRRYGKPLRLSAPTRTILRLAARDERGEAQWNGYSNMETLVTLGLIERLEGLPKAEARKADQQITRLVKDTYKALGSRQRASDPEKRLKLLRTANRALYDALQLEHKKTAVWYRITDAGRKAVA